MSSEKKPKTKTITIAILVIIIIVIAAIGVYWLTRPPPAPPKKVLKVALILPGKIDDVSWNQAAYEALMWLKKEYGDEIEVTYTEGVYDPVDIVPALRDYAEKGYDFIIGHGFQFMEPIIEVAPDYPNVGFALGTGYKTVENSAIYDVRLEEGGYLMGVLAALMTKTNKIGVIGGVDVVEIYRGHEGFKLGAKSIKPDITIYEHYTGDWRDAAGAKEAAIAMAELGADVIWHSGDGLGLGVIEAAKEKKFWVMGTPVDQKPLAPERMLSCVVYSWGPLFKQMIEDYKAGKYGGKTYWATFANGGISLAPFSDAVPKEIRDKVEQIKQDIITGKLKVEVPERA
ncbi:MAG: BMP family protein [Candidatus Bathyarchaeia archaeon]